MTRLVVLDDEAFMIVSDTVYDPVAVKTCVGFRTLLVPPSPKFHCHIVGVPTDVSVNWTAWPAVGDVGLKEKEAVKAACIKSERVVFAEPAELATVSFIVFVPDAEKIWTGFCAEEVLPSPKSQSQEVGDPVEVSVNWTDCPAAGEDGV